MGLKQGFTNSELTKEQTKDILLTAQEDFGLEPGQMAVILCGKKGYDTYKKWITDGAHLRKPTVSVLEHVVTLYDSYEADPEAMKAYLQARASNTD